MARTGPFRMIVSNASAALANIPSSSGCSSGENRPKHVLHGVDALGRTADAQGGAGRNRGPPRAGGWTPAPGVPRRTRRNGSANARRAGPGRRRPPPGPRPGPESAATGPRPPGRCGSCRSGAWRAPGFPAPTLPDRPMTRTARHRYGCPWHPRRGPRDETRDCAACARIAGPGCPGPARASRQRPGVEAREGAGHPVKRNTRRDHSSFCSGDSWACSSPASAASSPASSAPSSSRVETVGASTETSARSGVWLVTLGGSVMSPALSP